MNRPQIARFKAAPRHFLVSRLARYDRRNSSSGACVTLHAAKSRLLEAALRGTMLSRP